VSDTIQPLLAVLGRKHAARGVAPRDFRQPRRFGLARRKELELALRNLLPALERKLTDTVGRPAGLTLAGLDEADAETLFAQATEPPCVLRFRAAKAPAWLGWDNSAAVEAVEGVLGARGATTVSRVLCPTEARIASQFLSEVVRAVAGALALAPSDFVLVQAMSELGSWREAGAEAQSHRLEVRLALELGGRASTLRLFLPGVEGGKEPVEAPLGALPAHLEQVEVELSACLPGCEISLDQLLALEEGDVIPLEARLGDPTTLSVEGLTLARARIGSHRGRLAVRIERLSVQPETNPIPRA
jgi:flagellar motor switch protein FliM